MSFHATGARTTQGDSVVKNAVVTDYSRFADDHTHSVVDEESTTNLGSRVNLDPGKEPRDLGQQASQEPKAPLPELMADAMPPNCVQTRVQEEDDRTVRRCGVISLRRSDVLAKSNHKTLT